MKVGESEEGENEAGGINCGSRDDGEGAIEGDGIECQDNDSTKEVWEALDWVVILYDGMKYPGEVVKVIGNRSIVDVMAKSSSNGEHDIMWYPIADVLKKSVRQHWLEQGAKANVWICKILNLSLWCEGVQG